MNPGRTNLSISIEKAIECPRKREEPMYNSTDICRIVKLFIFAQSSELFALFVKWQHNKIVQNKKADGTDAERNPPNDQSVLQGEYWNGVVHLFLDEIHVNSKFSKFSVELLQSYKD